MGQLEDIQVFIRVVNTGATNLAPAQLDNAASCASQHLVNPENRPGPQISNCTSRSAGAGHTNV